MRKVSDNGRCRDASRRESTREQFGRPERLKEIVERRQWPETASRIAGTRDESPVTGQPCIGKANRTGSLRGAHDDLDTSQASPPNRPLHPRAVEEEPRCSPRSGRPRRHTPRTRRAGPPRGPGRSIGDAAREPPRSRTPTPSRSWPNCIHGSSSSSGASTPSRRTAWSRTSRPCDAEGRQGRLCWSSVGIRSTRPIGPIPG